MRVPKFLFACVVLLSSPLEAASPRPPPPSVIPMLPHDVIHGCFPLKPGSMELTAEGARGLDALIQLISPNPGRIMAEIVRIEQPWPTPGSAESLFLSDDGYQSFASIAPDGSRTEERVYTASQSRSIVGTVLPELPKIAAIQLSEARSTKIPRCGVEVMVFASLHHFPGPFYSYECGATGCRKLMAL